MERRVLFEDWPGPWGRWAEKYCRNNLWRVRMILGDMEDAMSECYIQFVECKRRYGASVNDPKWLMALYKMCVMSRFNDLSVKDSRYREVVDVTVYEGDSNQFDFGPFVEEVPTKTKWNEKGLAFRSDSRQKKPMKVHCGSKSNQADVGALLSVRISDASKELKQVLYIMLNAPAEVIQTIAADCGTPIRFFNKIVSVLGISHTDSQRIQQELRLLLR